MKVKQELLKLLSPQTSSDEDRLKIANNDPLAPPLEPADALTALFVLGYDKVASVAEAAKKSIEAYPAHSVIEALNKRLDPLVIKKAVTLHRDNEAVLIMAALNPGADDDTLRVIAETGPEELLEMFIEEKEMLRKKPFLAGAVKKNPLAGDALKKRVDSAVSSPEAEAPAGEEVKKDEPALTSPGAHRDEQNIYKLVQSLSMAQKVKYALCGNKSARELLIKDRNKMVAYAVLKNPGITDDEVLRVVMTKGTPDDVLRHIARNKEWIKSYNIRLGVVTNPKTPLTISIKMLDFLYEKDLAKLAKSKNVPSVLASSARKKIESKAKK
ncbi:MAG: hypothetical protein HZB22_01540 [Deltaproteobacteria bacterium]|nr:hypothetical protein [Deltaproteobacteria bacterium]